MTDQIDVDLDLGLEETTITEIPAAPPEKKKPTGKKKAAATAQKAEPEEIVVKEVLPDIDPEDDRANWPTIRIEHEKAKPNYEFVSAHGTKKNGSPFGWDMQIMRGVDVKVPPSIVHVLLDAVSTHYPTVLDPVTKEKKQLRQNRSAIPWTLVSGGKYIR